MPDISNNLVLRWQFADDLTDSVGSADITDPGGLSYAAGEVDQAVAIPSGTTLSAGNVAALDVGASDSFTVSAWVRADDAPGTTTNLLGKKAGYSASGAGWLVYCTASGQIQIMVADGTTRAFTATSTEPYLDGRAAWTHVAMVLNRSDDTLKMYINGQYERDSTNEGPVSSIGSLASSTAVQLCQQGVTTHWQDAVHFDDIRAYSRALTAGDIKALWIAHKYAGAGNETLDFAADFGATPDDSATVTAEENGLRMRMVLAAFEVHDDMIVELNDNFWVSMDLTRCDAPNNATVAGTGRLTWVGAECGIEFWRWTGHIKWLLAEMTIEPLPFVQGTVIDPVVSDGSQIKILLDEAYPTDLGLQCDWIETLEPTEPHLPKPEQQNWGEDWFGTPTLSGDRLTLTIPIAVGTSGQEAGITLTVGDKIVVDVYKNGTSGVDYYQGNHVTVQGATTYSATRVAHMFRQVYGDIVVKDVVVQPEPGKFRSVAGTAYNFSGCRGSVSVSNYISRRPGDDPLNIWTPRFKVENKSSATMDFAPDPQNADFKVGDVIEFYSADVIGSAEPDDLVPLGTATITAIVTDPEYWNGTWRVTISTNLGEYDPSDTDVAYNLTARPTRWSVSNVTWETCRSRGVLLQTPNGVIEHGTIRDFMQPAILFMTNITDLASTGATEGGRPSNITTRDIKCINCNYGTSINWGGVISAFAGAGPSDVQKAGFYQNINIYRMTILANEADSGVAIALRSVYGGFVGNNAISGYATEVLIDESSINIGQPPAAEAMIPSVLNYGLVDSDGNLKPGLVNTSYSGGSGDAETLKPSLLTPEGKLKPSLVDADQRVKPSMLRKN